MSPMFFTGTLAQWTGAARGLLGAAAVSLDGALAAAGLVRLVSGHLPARRASAAEAPQPPARTAAPRPSLPEAVTGAATSLLAVCGAMMTFAIAAGVLRALVSALFPGWAAAHGAAAGRGVGADGSRRRRGGGAGSMVPGPHGASVRAVLVRGP